MEHPDSWFHLLKSFKLFGKGRVLYLPVSYICSKVLILTISCPALITDQVGAKPMKTSVLPA
jgi:hypothetical protein